MKQFLIALAAICPVAAPAASQSPPELDSFVAAVMREFKVPGVAVSIVKDGQVVVARGYGVRSIDHPARVDEHTRFGIASNTKLFTATALAMLAEQGKLALDSPVIRYLPWFQMSDPEVTRQMTVRDLLVHRSGLGLGAGDLLWWPQTNYYRTDLVRRLKFVPLAMAFRKEYAYDNVLYTVAGEVVQVVSSNIWEQFVDHDILRRIGMSDSRVHHSNAADSGNVARTHGIVDGVVRRITPMTGDNTNPAGGINASAVDMGKWLIVQLDSGRLSDGSRLFQPSTTRELWTMVTPIPFESSPGENVLDRRTTNGYALGLNVRDYRGIPILLHTGSLPGYASRVLMIPSLRLGIAVLTNAESAEAHDAIAFHIADHYLGANDIDHLKEFAGRAKHEAAAAGEVERKAVVTRDSTRRPSLLLVKYARTYTDRWYGDVVVALEGSPEIGIRFTRTPALIGTLEHWEGDTFIARWRDRSLRADAYITFHIASDSTVDRVTMKPVSPLTDFSYDFQDLDLRPKRASTVRFNGVVTDSIRSAWTYGDVRTEGWARRIHGFGGFWVSDNSTVGHVYLMNLRDSIGAKQVLWKYPKLVFHQGKYDFIALDIWRYMLAREVVPKIGAASMSHGIDEIHNRIHFGVEDAATVELVKRIVKELGIPADAVDIEIQGRIRLGNYGV